MKRDFRDLEDFLREAKPKDIDASEMRKKVWQKVISAQRKRRKTRVFWGIPPWVWTLGSLVLILLLIMAMLFIVEK